MRDMLDAWRAKMGEPKSLDELMPPAGRAMKWRAIGELGTVYEVRGLKLFIDGEEAKRTNVVDWESVDDAKNAADSAEIANAHNDGLPASAWEKVPR